MSVDGKDESADVVIVGTGLVHSMLACALAWQGASVLHIDCNDYYGDLTPTFSISHLEQWCADIEKNGSNCYQDVSLKINHEELSRYGQYHTRHFFIDLIPKLLFANSELLSLLIKSGVYQYAEFLPLSGFHTFDRSNKTFHRLETTKNEIFLNDEIPLLLKRNLMRFLKIVMDWETQSVAWESYWEKPLSQFLSEKFKMDDTNIDEIVSTLGLSFDKDVSTMNAMVKIKQFLSSFDIYGSFPMLFSKYGGIGELSQGFCRSAAVGGATYKLKTKISAYDALTKTLTFDDNTMVRVNNKLVISRTQSSALNLDQVDSPVRNTYKIDRMIVVVSHAGDYNYWFKDGESAAVVVYPSGSLECNNKHSVQVVIYGSDSELCPVGTSLVYLTTIQEDPNVLGNALATLLQADPHEPLQTALTLRYSQNCEVPVNMSATTDCAQLVKPLNKDDPTVLVTPMPSAELSYSDETIPIARHAFETIFGDDEETFFGFDRQQDEDQDVEDP